MESFGSVLQLQVIIFLLMGIGIVLRRCGVVDDKGRACLTDLLIDLILPCNIIHAFMIEFNMDILHQTFVVLLIALGIQLLSWGLGKVLYRRVSPGRRGAMQYATMCSNAGFMGNPIVEEIYGSQGLLYASIYLIPLRFFMWTAGISCFTQMKLKDAVKKLAVHPCILAVWVGFFLMGTGLALPGALTKTINYLSACNLPVSILVIGTILAEVDPRTLADGQALGFCAVRLLLLPAAVLALCAALHLDATVTGVCVVLTCMPAGSTTAILAEKYGGDAAYASKLVLMSTILSLFSIPLFCWLAAQAG
jgi:predicted permease